MELKKRLYESKEMTLRRQGIDKVTVYAHQKTARKQRGKTRFVKGMCVNKKMRGRLKRRWLEKDEKDLILKVEDQTNRQEELVRSSEKIQCISTDIYLRSSVSNAVF